jgi:hypothetical protein
MQSLPPHDSRPSLPYSQFNYRIYLGTYQRPHHEILIGFCIMEVTFAMQFASEQMIFGNYLLFSFTTFSSKLMSCSSFILAQFI